MIIVSGLLATLTADCKVGYSEGTRMAASKHSGTVAAHIIIEKSNLDIVSSALVY
jgi:hypothetical protein